MSLLGIIQIILGISLWVIAIIVELSWLALCFGSVIIGILLLIFAPYLLLLPMALITTPANSLLLTGSNNLSSK